MSYIQGLKELQGELNKIEGRTMNGVLKASQHILKKSQTKVPVDTGALKRSGYIRAVEDGYEVGYEVYNGEYDYAPKVHEDERYGHPMHKRGRGEGHQHGYNCFGNRRYLMDAVSMTEIIDIIEREVLK